MTRPSSFNRFSAAAMVVAGVTLLWPDAASAQRRGGPSGHRGRAVIVAAPVYYGGYGFYDPFWYGYAPTYPYPYPYPYAYPAVSNIGSARIQIAQRNADVYVDGHLVGTVDNFDGVFQRLDLPAGEHELTIYLDGHKSLTENVLFRPGATLDIKGRLQPLAAGESAEPRPKPRPRTDAPRGGDSR